QTPPARERAARASALRRTAPSRRCRRGSRPSTARCARGAPSSEPAAEATAAEGATRSPAAARSRPQLPPTRRSPARSRPLSLERQVRLDRKRGDTDPREIEPPLVHDEATLPHGEELAVEHE